MDIKFTYKQNNSEIVDIEASDKWGDYPCYIRKIEKEKLRNHILEIINGKRKVFSLWSDCDPEESSSDFYVAFNNGKIREIRDIDSLCFYMNEDNENYDFYKVRLQDGLC